MHHDENNHDDPGGLDKQSTINQTSAWSEWWPLVYVFFRTDAMGDMVEGCSTKRLDEHADIGLFSSSFTSTIYYGAWSLSYNHLPYPNLCVIIPVFVRGLGADNNSDHPALDSLPCTVVEGLLSAM
jgi:hypothetical protein